MPNPTNTVVTLLVNTATINQNNKNSKVTFSDNQGDPAENPGNPNVYYSSVNVGAQISWIGQSENGTDTVQITSVSQKTTDGGSDILQSIGNPNNGQVTAIARSVYVSGDENYNVSFTINNNTSNPYTIDPKIRMKEGAK
ncbi:hypothetical protein [Winogradskyella sp. A3E31]|uniref:hypothetical protein n=1 Tax=Winogradskyella sp. A3E31 TaxID=3349637 RepID=UPI00398AAE8A